MNYYQAEVSEVLKKLDTAREGLSQEEAEKRLEKDGLNELQTETKINKFQLFISQFKSFIIYIMLFATVLSLLLQEYVDAGVITAILIANALIGYYQELSAHRSLEALKKMNIIKASVYRDGDLVKMESKYLVKGDIIHLGSGDKVPADCRIIKSSELKIEESALTGESVPVEKDLEKIDGKVQIGDQHNMVFSSTTVTEGTAKAVVVYTGMETEIGKITEMVQSAEEQLTPLQIRLDKFGQKLGYAVIAICVIVLLVMGIKEYTAHGFSQKVLLDILLVSVALAVAAVPSGLPAVVTIALSIGVKKLLKKKALVRKLASVETLGSCNVICSDKTGTLTQNAMTVKKVWTLESEAEVDGIGYDLEGEISNGKVSRLLFEVGKYCNDASHYKKDGEWRISGNPTEAALLVSAKKAKLEEDEIERIDEKPFDSARKRMSVLVRKDKQLRVFLKGAPDQVLQVCKYVYKENGKEALTDELKEKINDQIISYSSEALRVLSFAYKDIDDEKNFGEQDLVFVGLQAMIDPPRKDVIESIKRTKQAGMRVIMITGDFKETARAIGKDIGIEGEVLTGPEIDEMNDEEIEERLSRNTNIFARVIPEHKQRIVSALQRQENIVAMTGDGVNDAPALKKANIGIAVGSGTDAAKEASDFVLMDDSFTNIVNAIEEGRGIYENIQKAIMHLLSGNLSEVLIIFLATLMGWSLPLTALMLLWINLVTDGAPALSLAVDPYGKDIMKRKPKSSVEDILPRPELMLTTLMGLYATIIALVLFYLHKGESAEQLAVAQTTAFTFVVVSEFILLLVSRAFFGIAVLTNTWLWAAMAFCLVLQVILIYTPAQTIFELEELGLYPLETIAAGGLVLFIFCYITMRILRKQKMVEQDN